MKRAFLNVAGVALLAAGMALAQDAPAQNSPHAGRHSAQTGSRIDRLAARLNLTDSEATGAVDFRERAQVS